MTTEYFLTLAAAFVRGRLINELQESAVDPKEQTPHKLNLSQPVLTKALNELSVDEMEALIQIGKERDLRLHRFKKSMELPRVRKVLGILKGIQPQNLLDIGSGRGVFLWPLLNEFPFPPCHLHRSIELPRSRYPGRTQWWNRAIDGATSRRHNTAIC